MTDQEPVEVVHAELIRRVDDNYPELQDMEVLEVVITTDQVRVEVHRLGECLNPDDIAGAEWGPANLGAHSEGG